MMVWYTYRDLLYAVGDALSILWQLSYIATMVSSNKEAVLYVILFLVQPVTRDIFQPSLWGKCKLSVALYFGARLNV